MKTLILIINFIFINLALFGQNTNHVINMKLLEKSSNSITLAWVADANNYSNWDIDIREGSTSVNFTSDALNVHKYNISEPNVYVYRFSGLSPATTYYVYVKVDQNDNARKIEVTTSKIPGFTLTQSSNTQDLKCSSYRPEIEKTYLVSAWVKKDADEQNYTNCGVVIRVSDNQGGIIYTNYFEPSGQIIDRWQRIEGTFRIPSTEGVTPDNIEIVLINENTDNDVYFDDIRIFPKNGNLKSYVYDFETKKLKAELDQNNYATYYEYDQEGGLVRIKKETERGIYTIQETRSHTRKQENNSN